MKEQKRLKISKKVLASVLVNDAIQRSVHGVEESSKEEP
jgi:hypothetical protein